MTGPKTTFESAFTTYDRAQDAAKVAAGEAERTDLLERFPLDGWPTMPLERYALGLDESAKGFCCRMEFHTNDLGSIRGGTANKHLVYRMRDKSSWRFPRGYKDQVEAWGRIRGAFVRAFQLAKDGDWAAIDGISELQGCPALLLKSLHVYFPSDVMCIYSRDHLRHYLREFGNPLADDRSLRSMMLNRALLAEVRRRPEFDNWTINEIARFLYRWANPQEHKKVLKIAPGELGKYWEDCREGGYICVGWDDVGDLREFDSQEALRTEFERQLGDKYNHHATTITRKTNELWALRNLEVGDLVVANRGTSKVLAVGTVVEPAYFWKPERAEYRHCVAVTWDASYAKDITPVKAWATVTVAPVSQAAFKEIVGEKIDETLPLDPAFRDIGAALERKGQVVLYGPPGTGKTYTARRFAVAWLLQNEGRPDVQGVLGDRAKFELAERSFSTNQVTRRVWWMVASVKEWSWEQLAKQGKVAYRQGRLKRNFPLLREGDLVIGYQSTPDKRIAALARVSRALSAQDGEESGIELSHVAAVTGGLTYEELMADPILKTSEPLRFRNQGTLFALTADEAEHALALLAERDPAVQPHLEGEQTVGLLTRLTFHPSYSYEDFVEGFRPVETGDGALSLRLEAGIFKRICQAAIASPKKKFLVLIDEINRANIAKVFGELITLLEMDKRGLLVTLPQSKESFCIPPNLFVLGTMNTADRSIKLLDAALRRRFAFVELMPEPRLLQGGTVNGLCLDDFLEGLNRRIAGNQGREKQIGHSFLLDEGEPLADPDEFARRFRQEILPLLQEYCYEDYGALAAYIGGALVDAENQTLNFECLNDPSALIAALENEFNVSKGPVA